MQPALNEQAILAAWLRVRALAAESAPVDAAELRNLELALRPVAGVSEIQQAMVPLLDRSGFPGLAMAWDGEPQAATDAWLRTRFDRWLALGAAELAFLTLAQMQTRHCALEGDRPRANALLQAERAARQPLLAANLAALSEVDADLTARVVASPRLSVALRPLGTGISEYASGGTPPLQLWAATPAEAVDEAMRLCARCTPRGVWFVAGIGDGSLPAVAAAMLTSPVEGMPRDATVHVIEAHLVRLRALLEVVDLTGPLRARRLQLHGGAAAIESVAAVLAKLPPLEEDAVVGGDALSISVLESAASRAAGR